MAAESSTSIAAPTVSGPLSYLEEIADGEWQIQIGQKVARMTDGPFQVFKKRCQENGIDLDSLENPGSKITFQASLGPNGNFFTCIKPFNF